MKEITRKEIYEECERIIQRILKAKSDREERKLGLKKQYTGSSLILDGQFLKIIHFKR